MIKPLIYNSDIKTLRGKQSITRQELELIQQCDLTEARIQQSCKRIFDSWIVDNQLEGLFVQIDNGGKSGIQEKVKKKLMGTVAGMPDVMLLVQNKEGRTFEVFIEFKRISSPKAIKPSEYQIDTQEKIKGMGYEVYLTNNTVFFTKKILGTLLERLKPFANSKL